MPNTTNPENTDLRDYIKSRLGEHDPLNLHLLSAHCNGAALGLTRAEALDSHRYEHTGPGGIRNHDPKDLFWDPDRVVDILIESAEMNGEDLRAEVDRLLTPAEERVVMNPYDHTHEYTVGQDWVVCPDGNGCAVYPRVYDIRTTRRRDGSYGAVSYGTITNVSDDIARCLIDARGALTFMEVEHHDDGLGDMARDALARLNSAVAMLYPMIYPDHARSTSQDPS